MDENNSNSKMNSEAGEKKKVEDPAPASDWELLSMSMTASVSDLKSALAAAEEEGGDAGSVSEATMHSQYFGQVMASVLPVAPPGEIFPQQEGEQQQPGKQSDPEETKANQPPLEVAEELEAELRREIEQQILAEALGEVAGKSPEAASAAGLRSPTRSFTAEVVEMEEVEGFVKAEVAAATVVSSAPKSKLRSNEWMKRRLQVIAKKVNRSSTVWSIALVAAVTGLFIIGKRWYYDSFKSLDITLDSYTTDEKLSEIAQEIAEGNNSFGGAGDSSSAAAAAPEAVEAQSSSGGLFGTLRDFW